MVPSPFRLQFVNPSLTFCFGFFAPPAATSASRIVFFPLCLGAGSSYDLAACNGPFAESNKKKISTQFFRFVWV
jgi:hypothetical protein